MYFKLGYKMGVYKKYDGQKGNTKEHVVCFLNLIGPFTHDIDLCLKEFSKFLTNKAYTW